MNILLIGSGGREHALAWAIAASPLTDRLVSAPGSDARAQIGTCVDISVDDQAALLARARLRLDLPASGVTLHATLAHRNVPSSLCATASARTPASPLPIIPAG